jgi:hypothetical protein
LESIWRGSKPSIKTQYLQQPLSNSRWSLETFPQIIEKVFHKTPQFKPGLHEARNSPCTKRLSRNETTQKESRSNPNQRFTLLGEFLPFPYMMRKHMPFSIFCLWLWVYQYIIFISISVFIIHIFHSIFTLIFYTGYLLNLQKKTNLFETINSPFMIKKVN